MAMDGFSVFALSEEINKELSGTRVDKIQQTEHDELLISFFGKYGQKKLRLTANPSFARVCLTQDKKQSPKTAPLFCMLLRKHLSGAKFLSATQPDFERIMILSFDGTDEFGENSQKKLICELMGRHSNIILTDKNDKIIDSIKHIDFSVSSVRQILPGLTYQNPPSQNKINPLKCSLAEITDAIKNAPPSEKNEKIVMSLFSGVSPLISREICGRANVSDMFLEELDFNRVLDLSNACFEFFKKASEKSFSPCYLVDNNTEKPFEFCAFTIEQYEKQATNVLLNSMSCVVEDFYKERDKKERMSHKSAKIAKIVSNNIERCAKKLSNQTAELNSADNLEKYKQYGELITANLYRINKGDKNAAVENYYNNNEIISIPLDEQKTPSENAQRYFKKYSKAKNAKAELTRQISIARQELAYLESVEEELQKAENERDIAEISEELYEQGYIKRNDKSKNKREISKPMEFKTKDGFTVLVGKNNKQNDILTLKTAKNKDMWFHTKDIHGSHVILCYEHGKDFSDSAIIEAATYAARYSKAKNSSGVPVDYTYVKYVKKPSGAAPGMVIYTDNKTVYVTP